MSDALEAESDVDGTQLYEEQQDSGHELDFEVREMESHDHMNTDHLELEHSELEHVHLHHEDNTELVQRHFPHLAPPQQQVDHTPVLIWLGTFVLMAVAIAISYESLRWFIKARHASSNTKKKKSKEKENTKVVKSGPMPLAEALRVLSETSLELRTLPNSAHPAENTLNIFNTSNTHDTPGVGTVQQYAEIHYSQLSKLAFSLYEHVYKNFHQFEAVSGDTSWLQGSDLSSGGGGSYGGSSTGNSGSSGGSSVYGYGSVDVISEISARVDTIMSALTPTTHTTHTTHSTHSHTTLRTRTTHTTHIEDRLHALYTQWGLSDIRVQYSLVHDALLKVQCVSSKGYVSEIMNRLGRAVETRNEYHLLDATTLLQELDQHALLCTPLYTTAVEVLSGIHDAEDRKVRRDAQEQLLLDQNEMMDTFQAFSTPREQGSAKKPPLTLTNNITNSINSTINSGTSGSISARNRTFSTPIVPNTAQNGDFGMSNGVISGTSGRNSDVGVVSEICGDSGGEGGEGGDVSVADVCTGVECMTITSGVSGSMDVGTSTGDISADIVSSIPTATPLTIDSSCLSPEHSTKYYNTVTSPNNTSNTTYNTTNTNAIYNITSPTNNTLTTTTNTTPNDTTLLISSQWAMEALKLRREAQNNVEHKLHRIREKRAENEARARGRARVSIEERGKEVRGAKLFLEGLDEQRKTRQAAETEAFTLQEKELLHEFTHHKQTQQALDYRAYTILCVLYVVVYLLVYSGYSVNSGLGGLYGWMLNTMRSSCDFLACEKRANRAVQLYSINTSGVSGIGSVSSSTSSVDSTQLLLPDTPHYTEYTHSVYKQPSLQIVIAYQSTYRTATHYLDTLLTPVSSYALKYALGGYIRTPSVVYTTSGSNGSSGGVWYELYRGCRCMMHVLLRTLPATALSKLLAFIGWKKISSWVAVFLTFLCFSDILVQMAVGPLLPLLTILALHTLLYSVVTVVYEHKLRWMVRGYDARYIVMYVLYPVVGLYVVYNVAQRA